MNFLRWPETRCDLSDTVPPIDSEIAHSKLDGGKPRSVRGRFLGKTDDGWDRYEVNWAAITPPPEIRAQKPKTEKPFRRVTIASATKDEVNAAMHKVLMKQKRKAEKL